MTGADITKRVKEIRTILGLTQGEMAERLDITQQAYSFTEHSSNLQIETLIKISQILNVHPVFIMAVEIPVTSENLRKYRNGIPKNLTEELFNLKSKVSFYKNLLSSSITVPQSQSILISAE